jgi:hypothetical protein
VATLPFKVQPKGIH